MMDSWSSWDDGKQRPPMFQGIQDYIDDLFQQEMPVRLVVDMDPYVTRFRARIVDADNPGEILLDRLGERYMEVSGNDLQRILVELDVMAAIRPRR